MSLANEGNQRGLRDFLTLYNTITEYCFNKCVSNFNDRGANPKEKSCVDICTDNYVQYNQRFMFNFVDHQERRKREAELALVEAAKKEEAAALQAAAQEAAKEMAVSDEKAQENAEQITQADEMRKQATQMLESLSSSSSVDPSPLAQSTSDQNSNNNNNSNNQVQTLEQHTSLPTIDALQTVDSSSPSVMSSFTSSEMSKSNVDSSSPTTETSSPPDIETATKTPEGS